MLTLGGRLRKIWKRLNVEFGLLVTQFSSEWRHALGDARLADEIGLDSIWMADHLLPTMNVEGNVFEGWTAMAALAGNTERVRLGHLVLAASFRNPGLMAKMAATLDHASAGRLDFGLGAGWFEAEYKAFGYRFPSPGERRRYFEEYLDALRLLFSGGPVDYEGEFHQAESGVLPPDASPGARTADSGGCGAAHYARPCGP